MPSQSVILDPLGSAIIASLGITIPFFSFGDSVQGGVKESKKELKITASKIVYVCTYVCIRRAEGGRRR